ncbi:MAG: homoserine dehydrogenase [Deltaproteobacteria bacterium]|nr:homoserine dehydrogenase [Deltaproteobacteria bacterium]
MKTIRLGLLGLGTVGSGVLEILARQGEELTRRTGARFEVARYCSRSPEKWAALGLDPSKGTTDPMALVNDPKIDVLVELAGGIDLPKKVILAALDEGKDVVTANKALLSECADEIFAAVSEANARLGFEASVCGGIPIIRLLQNGLASERIKRLTGIVNGTCNYILTVMTDAPRPFDEVLAEAQALGYAEADPTLDIDGSDSAHKLSLLAMLAWGVRLKYSDIHTHGITEITATDIAAAGELKMIVKLLAVAERHDDGRLGLYVGPHLLPEDSVLGQVSDATNAVMVDGANIGQLVITGAGAGKLPTANSVVADLIAVARQRVQEADPFNAPAGFPEDARAAANVVPFEEQIASFYLRISAIDKPGVLADVARILADHKISIASMIQHGRDEGESVSVIILTHEASRGALKDAVARIDDLETTTDRTVVMTVMEDAS